MSLNLLKQLSAVANNGVDTVAITEESGAQISLANFIVRVTSIQRGFETAGMRAGDRVLFAIRPSIEAIATIVAIAELGAVIVAAPIGAGDELFRTQMRLVQPKWVVAESMLVAAMQSALVRKIVAMRGGLLPSMDVLSSARFVAAGRWLPGLGGADRLHLLEKRAKQTTRTDANNSMNNTVDDSAELFIVFTSGTTAAPKAVVHSRGSLGKTLAIVSDTLGVHPGERLCARDLHLILPALLAGGTVFIPKSGRFNAQRTALWLSKAQCTHLFDVTANVQQLVDYLTRTRNKLPSSVRKIMIGAAPVRKAFFQRLKTVLPPNAEAWCVYGMTEMLPIATIELKEKLAFKGSGDIVGHPVPGVDVSLSDANELLVRGEHLFSGYLGMPAATVHATGDLATLDNGRIVLVGRAKDMIIRREYNIYPELHESIIEQISGVRRCAMIGIHDDALEDERVILFVEPANEPRSALQLNELVAHINDRLRNGPHRIDEAALPDEIVVTDLPESGRSNKIDKAALRDSFRARRIT